MKVLVTGGSGTLAQILTRELLKYGHTVTLVDKRPFTSSTCQTIIADIRNESKMMSAMANHDVVVHTAALHGVHKSTNSELDFLDVNILGTYQVLNAALLSGVRRVVFASSTSVYGVSRKNMGDVAVYIDENTEKRPLDINDLTKVKGELLCEYFNAKSDMECISLRIGRFFKGDDWLDYNLTKLYGGIDVNDVAQGIRLAVEAIGMVDKVFCLASKTRFTKNDLKGLIGNANEVIEMHYPGAKELFASNGWELPRNVHRIVDISRAEKQLGFKPVNNFDVFLDELRMEKSVITS